MISLKERQDCLSGFTLCDLAFRGETGGEQRKAFSMVAPSYWTMIPLEAHLVPILLPFGWQTKTNM